ncbi:class I SAM-dependent methyltransferase [Streptomyces sp. MUM 203J]|uniref:class I SAM-dependent methyltransferase n=1 Tax=Streptomyces sp. MUM 203J TaxID=2791990 RepID=UPI001F04C4D6|nr:class I SAM-dependent methyltransferase [Streptomyces sp. MUM 203J]MCH0542969.1 class I SAM-dependent methyltransferase [Streptomyces sp. MUM 203J]
MDRTVRTHEDVLRLLDDLIGSDADRSTAGAGTWWDTFYEDRTKPVPFFVHKPDENLADYVGRGLTAPGRALDIGCGPGRNALYLAGLGFDTDAVDLSAGALAWAEDRARETGVTTARFHHGDAFALTLPDGPLTGPYDLVYDSGCFHQLPPHRRVSYLALLDRVLAPGGAFALTCFAAGEGGMGWETGDTDFYRGPAPRGGLAYTPESLRAVFSGMTEIEIRRMHQESPESAHFGESFLWTALFRRPCGT